MSNLTKVNPGDLIQAAQFNSLVDAIVAIQNQLLGLTAVGSKVIITGITPNGIVPIGTTITITGQNFSTPPESNQVNFSGISVAALSGSNYSSTFIQCEVPQLQIPSGSSSIAVPVIVSNTNGTSTPWTISVGPQPVLVSVNPSVNYAGVAPGSSTQLTPGTQVTLTFTVQISAVLASPTTFTASINSFANTGWAQPQFASNTTPTLTLQPSAIPGQLVNSPPWALNVVVTVPSNAPTNANPPLVITVSSQNPQSSAVSQPATALAYNGAAPGIDPRVQVAPIGATPFVAKVGVAMTSAGVGINATTTGHYSVTFQMSPDTGWTLTSPTPTPVAFTGPATPKYPMQWTPPAGWTATSTTNLLVTVTSSDAGAATGFTSPNFKQTYSFPVVGSS